MNSNFNQVPVDEEIQVYRNDFLSGIMMLVKKLFMI